MALRLQSIEAVMAVAASDEGLDVGERVGRYLLTHELAAGGMGTVYLARVDGPKGFGKLVAVKLMHPGLVDSDVADMFADEARIASLIHHPNVCQIYDFGEHDGVFYLVMELLSGVPLSQLVAYLGSTYHGIPRNPSYFALVARVMVEMLHGLHAVHEITDDDGRPLEVVHRDISPDNIFVTWDGAVRIVDFGIAGGRGRIHRTQAGTFKGKLAYAAPEQFRGSVTRVADVWSAGAVLWELLTLRPAFERENEMETLTAVTRAHVTDARQVAPDVPAALAAIAHRALSLDPRARYRTAREMAREISAWAAGQRVVDTTDVSMWVQSFCPSEYEASRALLAAARAVGKPSSALAWAATAVDERLPPERSEPTSVSGVRTLIMESEPPAPAVDAIEAQDDRSGVRPSTPEVVAPRRRLAFAVMALLAAAAVVAGAIAGLLL